MTRYLTTAAYAIFFLATAPVCTVLGTLLWLVSAPFDRNHASVPSTSRRWACRPRF